MLKKLAIAVIAAAAMTTAAFADSIPKQENVKSTVTKSFGDTTVAVDGIWYNQAQVETCVKIKESRPMFTQCLRQSGIITAIRVTGDKK